MKKFILIMSLLAGLTVSAQTRHLEFKGIPIDGTLNEFVSKLQKKGFVFLAKEDGMAFLTGEFAAYKGCAVVVIEHESSLVYRVGVIFPERETWSLLYADYVKLKAMLTQKYGNPTSELEEFQGYTPDDDMLKMNAVQMDRCKYICDFTADNGVIELKISHSKDVGCSVVLLYKDKENESKVQSRAMEDL